MRKKTGKIFPKFFPKALKKNPGDDDILCTKGMQC